MYDAHEHYLVVEMLQAAQDDSGKALIHVVSLNVGLHTDQDGVKTGLVAHAINVLGRVRVDALERLGELVVKAFHQADNGARNANRLALLRHDILVFVVELLGALANDIGRVGLEDLQKAADFDLNLLPDVDLHVLGHALVKVEARRDDGKQDEDLLEGGLGGGEEFLQGGNLFITVGVLP